MPTSRKRKKKPTEEGTAVLRSSNIVKSPLGKAVIILLSGGFVLSILIGFIYTLVTVMKA